MERAQKKVESRNFDIRKTLIKFDDVMNDQRHVIFSQRLKILKDDDTSDILNDFLEEIIKELESNIIGYKKSNDDKFLTEIKNVIGNSISEKNLILIASQKEGGFAEHMRSIFFKKRKSREEMLGKEQNNILEKKIFLQIIDFSWRSHLQYLEQLRQVIGLRQYGQKDPYQNLRKRLSFYLRDYWTKLKKI